MIDLVVDPNCRDDVIYLVPKIEGLCMINGELKVAEKRFHEPSGQTIVAYRNLTDDEKRRFAKLEL